MDNSKFIKGLVSIIMPSWNTEKYIGEAIQSVINQIYTNWELIIVDDCSTDNTEKIVSKFNDKRIKFFKNEKNLGAALSRNKALREAKGEWIAFLDSDDVRCKDKLEKQISFMEKNGYILSYTEYEKIDEKSKSFNITVTGPEHVDKKKIYRYDYIGQLTMIYNANKFGVIQIDDISKNNDYAIRLKLYNTIPDTKAYLLKQKLAKYRVRKVSISHDKFIKKFKSHYNLFHICDKKNSIISLLYACRNMFYGVFKKIKYEN
ncbi:glycosyltransferase family 2 protein [Anaerococcus sp. WCA-380-WT-2B]|uniref:Glycosyltransferase family 2 protein n=1 Tax=Anaerococcus porci TaxID=2652269 RepID=A0A6N7VE03_9FIRM|nr:glycosyltransferase family 2 protein [Anaerococcus porci]MSS77678.1 glycosyltransferase family 2 protein [Anaerococcus porci]